MGADALTCGFVEVDVNALQLQVVIAVIRTGWIDSMFVGYHLPKLHEQLNNITVLDWSFMFR